MKTRFFSSKLIYDGKRALYSYHISKLRLANVIKTKYPEKIAGMLIAPCGGYSDYPYVRDHAQEIHDIDLSETAIRHCGEEIITKVGDILKLGYEDKYSKIILSSLFSIILEKLAPMNS